MVTAKTLEGFGGLLRKYCPQRCGPFFTELIRKLVDVDPSTDSSSEPVLKKEKLVALMTNQVSYSKLYQNAIGHFCWQPLADVDINKLKAIVGQDEFRSIEKDNRGKDVVHCYRTSNKLNHHGYGNYRPNLDYKFKFISYRDRQ